MICTEVQHACGMCLSWQKEENCGLYVCIHACPCHALRTAWEKLINILMWPHVLGTKHAGGASWCGVMYLSCWCVFVCVAESSNAVTFIHVYRIFSFTFLSFFVNNLGNFIRFRRRYVYEQTVTKKLVHSGPFQCCTNTVACRS